MKNIAFVSPTGTLDNGAEISIVNFMKFLNTKGYNVFNIFPKTPSLEQDRYISLMLENNINYLSIPSLHWWWEGSPFSDRGTKEERSYYYQQYIFSVRQFLRDNQIDIVISNTANVFQGAISAAFEGIEHYWLVHEFPIEEFEYYRENISFMAQMSDRIFSVRGNLHKTLLKLFPNEVQLGSFMPYTNINVNELAQGKQKRILSIGRINDNKNQLELLKAYIELNRLEVPLIFIGSWDNYVKQKMDSIIEKFNLTNVHFLGHKENPWQFVTDSDICVYTSKSEAFSLVFVESILNGIPTIVSNNKGYSSVRETFNVGLEYKLGNVKELSILLNNVLDNYSLYKLDAHEKKIDAQKIYTLNNAYSELLVAIEDKFTYKEKSITPLKSLLGLYSPKQDPWLINQQFLELYEADSSGIFTKSIKKVNIKYKDKIEFFVSDTCVHLRVNFTERSNISANINLKIDDLEIKPVYFNAILENNVYHFTDQFPQVIFNLEGYNNSLLTLEYEIADTYDMYCNRYLEKVSNYHQEMETEINNLRLKLDNISNEYNKVVGSRRWIIPTKIINFFKGR